jgi:hypothetical protein
LRGENIVRGNKRRSYIRPAVKPIDKDGQIDQNDVGGESAPRGGRHVVLGRGRRGCTLRMQHAASVRPTKREPQTSETKDSTNIEVMYTPYGNDVVRK